MILKSLSSSSKGNIHILENGETTILLDCGIKFQRLADILNPLQIDGVLITHEHGDHVGGCKSLSENKRIVFYGTKETLEHIKVPEFSKVPLEPFKTYKIGTFSIVPFEVKHDAVHPVNYLIKDTITGAQMLYITDTGYIDNLRFKDIDYILIECNFDEEWYSPEVIDSLSPEEARVRSFRGKRLLSKEGHLSIQKTIRVLKNTINHNTKKIVLCHISHNYEGYKEFESKIKAELKFESIVALNPMYIGLVINEFREKKEVIPFE